MTRGWRSEARQTAASGLHGGELVAVLYSLITPYSEPAKFQLGFNGDVADDKVPVNMMTSDDFEYFRKWLDQVCHPGRRFVVKPRDVASDEDYLENDLWDMRHVGEVTGFIGRRSWCNKIELVAMKLDALDLACWEYLREGFNVEMLAAAVNNPSERLLHAERGLAPIDLAPYGTRILVALRALRIGLREEDEELERIRNFLNDDSIHSDDEETLEAVRSKLKNLLAQMPMGNDRSFYASHNVETKGFRPEMLLGLDRLETCTRAQKASRRRMKIAGFTACILGGATWILRDFLMDAASQQTNGIAI